MSLPVAPAQLTILDTIIDFLTQQWNAIVASIQQKPLNFVALLVLELISLYVSNRSVSVTPILSPVAPQGNTLRPPTPEPRQQSEYKFKVKIPGFEFEVETKTSAIIFQALAVLAILTILSIVVLFALRGLGFI